MQYEQKILDEMHRNSFMYKVSIYLLYIIL